MSQIHKRTFVRNDDKELILYGYQEHKEPASQQLDVNNMLNPHMRWNPSREEWVTYSAGRKNRTSFPPKEYCPLCPGANLNYPTEIPFSNSVIRSDFTMISNLFDFEYFDISDVKFFGEFLSL